MVYLMICLPLFLGVSAALVPSNRHRPWLLAVAGTAHLILTLAALNQHQSASDLALSWLQLDAVGRFALLVISILFFFCSVYAVGYLQHRQQRPNRIFCVCLSVFLALATLAAWAHHLGLMWVAIEAATVIVSPLIYFNHTQRCLEATWKYLIVGSVGVALALLGTFFLAYSAFQAGIKPNLTTEAMVSHARDLSLPWLKVAFVLLMIGYGCKMGLAPMHTWKPDVYGEVPGVVGAIFAGGLSTCAFLALLRIYPIYVAAGQTLFISRILVGFGLFSMLIAAIFMMGQRDFKRMLAYSSIEQMGILSLGLGFGGSALFGTLLHVLTHALTKGALFLSAGNIHRAYESKWIEQVCGAMRRLPWSAGLFVAGFLAVTGTPPFGCFLSIFLILRQAVALGRFGIVGVVLLLLLLVFLGMGYTVLRVVQGRAPAGVKSTYRDGLLTVLPVFVLMALSLCLGIFIPEKLQSLLQNAVAFLEAQS